MLNSYEIFSLILQKKLWLGATCFTGGAAYFITDSERYDPEKMSNPKHAYMKNGNFFWRVNGVRWYTNLDHKKRHEKIDLVFNFNSEDYPLYENYNAINVDKATNIPKDYDGYIGVPISFMDKYNPEQFEIIALGIVGSCNFTSERKMEILNKNGEPTGKFTINAKGTLYRKHKKTDKKPPAFKDCETGELYQSIYARIIIKRK